MKILVIGCGSIGQRHIRNLVSLKAGKIIAFDVDRKKLKEVRNISRSIVLSDRLVRLWKEKPDAAFITVPTSLHIRYALAAAKRGCHLFIEKPLSHNLQNLNKLLKIVRLKKLVTLVAYNYRFNNCLIKTKELLKNNAIGKIIAGRIHFGSYLPERHPGEDYRCGYGARKSLGGGTILDVLSHQLDSVIFLFGRPKEVLGYSCRGSSLDINVEDTSEVLIKLSKGGIINLHANFFQRPYTHTLELAGEDGTIFCDFAKNALRHYDVNKRKWLTWYSNRNPNRVYIKEIKHFIKCIEERLRPTVDIVRGKEELELLMKIKKSVRIKRWLKI